MIYEWYIDDSTEPTLKGREATLTLEQGEYKLKLRVRDSHSGMAESEAILTVKKPDDDHGVKDTYWGWLIVLVIVTTLLLSALYVRYGKHTGHEG